MWDKEKRKSVQAMKEGVDKENDGRRRKYEDPCQIVIWRSINTGATFRRESENHSQDDKAQNLKSPWCETGEVEDLHRLFCE